MSTSEQNPLPEADSATALPWQLLTGLELFNAREFFESHEALEDAWRAEPGPIRELYQGILQAAVSYLHITHQNYPGATIMAQRSQKKLAKFPDTCLGIDIAALRRDLETAIAEIERLGPQRMAEFDVSLFKPVIRK